MKYFKYSFLFSLIFFFVFNQFDIKAQVKNQINLKSIIDQSLAKTHKLENNNNNIIKAKGITKPVNVNGYNLNKFFEFAYFAAEAALLFLIVKNYRNRRSTMNKKKNSTLKKNISLLRNEMIKTPLRKDQQEVREKIGNGNIKIDIGTQNLTHTAKKLNISKGEIYLAAKLKLMTSNAK